MLLVITTKPLRQKTVNVDVDVPTVSIIVPSTPQNDEFSATITFSEDVTGFTSSGIRLMGPATFTLSGSGKNYTATITPTSGANGIVTISIPVNVAQDSAGNNNTASSAKTVTVDKVAPTVTITPPSGDQEWCV